MINILYPSTFIIINDKFVLKNTFRGIKRVKYAYELRDKNKITISVHYIEEY